MVEQTHDVVKVTLHWAPPTSPAFSPPAPHPHLTPELCQSARFSSMELPWTVTSAWTAQPQFLGLLSLHVGLRWGTTSSAKTPSPPPLLFSAPLQHVFPSLHLSSCVKTTYPPICLSHWAGDHTMDPQAQIWHSDRIMACTVWANITFFNFFAFIAKN